MDEMDLIVICLIVNFDLLFPGPIVDDPAMRLDLVQSGHGSY